MTGLDGSSKINSRALLHGFLLRFDSGEEKNDKSKTEEKKIAWEKKSNKYLNLLKIWPLWDLKPQAFLAFCALLPMFLSWPCSTTISKSFETRRHSNRATPKNSRGMLWFLPSHRNTVRKKFLHTREPHFCVFLLVSSLLCKTPFSFLCSKNPRSIHRKFMSALFSTFTLVEMQSCFHLRGFGSQIQRQKIGITLWNFETAPQ